jgi:hypothetical protein
MGYIGSAPATNFETVRKQVSTTNSGTTITLDYSVSSVQDILVTVNAVVQSYDNYSVSGTTLTLGGTLNNDRVEILYVGRTFQTVTPAVGTVTNDMLSGSIANSKLANSSITLNGSAVSLGGSFTTSAGSESFYARPSGDNGINDNTNSTIVLDSELYDNGNNFNTSTYTYTIPSNGYYQFFATIRFNDGSNTGMRKMWSHFNIDGSDVFQAYHEISVTSDIFYENSTFITLGDNFTANQTIKLRGYFDSGGNSAGTIKNGGTSFSGFRLA